MKKLDGSIYSMILYALVMIGLWGCGYLKPDKSDPAPIAPVSTQDFQLHGSVTSAFQVTVDGKSYPDMESYYTYQIGQLDSQATAAGYPGYSTKFEAQIGYKDLSSGMSVYVSPEASRGYSGQTSVGSDGNFTLTLPAKASGDTYQVKATKRIGLTLTSKTDIKDVKKFCWNFNAQNLSVPYSDKDKPIVLNNFVSNITAYECQADTVLSGVNIPQNSSGTTANSSGTAVGAPNLSVPDQMSFLPAPPPTDDLIYISTSPYPLVRSHDRTTISEVQSITAMKNLLDFGGSATNLSLTFFAGTPYIQVYAMDHGLHSGDQVYLQGNQAGFGFTSNDLNSIFVVELTPTANTFVIRASHNSTGSGTLAPVEGKLSEIAYLLTTTKPVWKKSDGPTTKTTEYYFSYTVDSTGKVCSNTVCK